MPDAPEAPPKPAAPAQPTPPAPAPAAPAPAPAPAPSPAPPPAPAPSAPESDPFAEADKQFLADAKASIATPPAAPAKPDPKGGATPPAAPKPAPTGTPAELRTQYERTKKEYETLKTEHETVKSKIIEAEARGKDTDILREQLKAMEKEKTEMQAELRAFRHESDPKFQEQYEKPFQTAAGLARSDIEELTFTEDDGTTRPAQWTDFVKIFGMRPTDGIEEAEKRFGKAHSIVTQHLTECRRLRKQRDAALEDERANAQERMKAEQTRRATMQEEERNLTDRVSRDLSEAMPVYRDDPADKEAAELRQKAYSIYDAQPMTRAEAIKKNAHIRHRVAAVPVLLLKIQRLETKLAELQGSATDDSQPGGTHHPGGGDGSGGTPPDEPWEATARKELGQT